jgi:hypothetical protein
MPRLGRHTGQDQKFREGYLMQAILGSWSVMFLLVALSGAGEQLDRRSRQGRFGLLALGRTSSQSPS